MSDKQIAHCAVCGRRATRQCSGLSAVICNSCCGARRGAKIDCHPECPHFPFGRKAYDKWLRVDGSWQVKALGYVIDKVGKKEFEITARKLAPSWIKGDPAFIEGAGYALIYYLTTARRDGAATIGETWKREGWPGLNNDERYMAEYRIRSIPAIIEVQKKLDDTAMECIDLLDSERGQFVVFDRNTARNVARFTRMVVWITHYPHFTRLVGSGLDMSEHVLGPFLSEIRLRAEEKLDGRSDEAVKEYLSVHFNEALELIRDLSAKWRERMIASLDSDRCRAFFKLRAPRGDIESVLEEKPDFEIQEDWELGPDDPPDAAYYMWLRRGEAKLIEEEAEGLIRHGDEEEDGVGILGTVRLTDDELTVETMGRVRFAFAGKLTRSYFKRKIKLVDEEITPIDLLLEEREDFDSEPDDISDGLPPEVEKQVTRKFYEKSYSNFLDDPIPMLDNMTPRAASQRPAMRSKLKELVKLHLQQMDKLRIEKGVDIDIGWIIDELGLDELK